MFYYPTDPLDVVDCPVCPFDYQCKITCCPKRQYPTDEDYDADLSNE